MKTIKKKIQRSFSRAAKGYDDVCGFHSDIACELIRRISGRQNIKKILDLGMGTGILTQKLRQKFPDAFIAGLDFSSGMIEAAKKKLKKEYIVQADTEHLPFKEDIFDIVLSNLSYQWENDLIKSFKMCRSVLKNNGSILFSIFGKDTFKELFFSLENAFKVKYPEKVFYTDRLADQEFVFNSAVSAGFTDVEINSSYHKMYFSDVFDIIRWVTAVGGNSLKRNYYFGKELLLLSDQHYQKNFQENGKVFATAQIIWLTGKK